MTSWCELEKMGKIIQQRYAVGILELLRRVLALAMDQKFAEKYYQNSAVMRPWGGFRSVTMKAFDPIGAVQTALYSRCWFHFNGEKPHLDSTLLAKYCEFPRIGGGMLWPSKGCNATAYKIQSQKRFEVKHQQISQFIAIPTRMNEAKSRDLTIKFIYSSFCYDKSRWLIYHVWAILHQSEQCFTAIYDDKQYYSDSLPLQNSIKTLISTAHDLHISSNSSTRSSSPSFRQNSPRIR